MTDFQIFQNLMEIHDICEMLFNCSPVGPALPRADAHRLDAVPPLLHQAGDGPCRPRSAASAQEEGRRGRRGWGTLQPRGGGGVAPASAGLPGPASKDSRPARLSHPGEAVPVGSPATAPSAVEAPFAVVKVVADFAPGLSFSFVVISHFTQ